MFASMRRSGVASAWRNLETDGAFGGLVALHGRVVGGWVGRDVGHGVEWALSRRSGGQGGVAGPVMPHAIETGGVVGVVVPPLQ